MDEVEATATPLPEMLRPRLIVGLGNPGEGYARTRHNAGFLAIERFLRQMAPGARETRLPDAMACEIDVDGRRVWTLRPLTYMNRSGEVVAPVAQALGLQPAELLLIYDCLDLPLGRIRLRQAGSSGGHRGVESILQALGTDTVPRLRLGIGRPGQQEVVEHVLSPWSDVELALADAVLTAAAEAVRMAVHAGVPPAMNAFNGWQAPAAERDDETG